MSFQAIVIRHSGQWKLTEYEGGDEVVVYMSNEDLCHAKLMQEVHDQLNEDGRSTYMLFYTSTTDEGRKIKVALKTDSDLNRLISEHKKYPVVYVIEKGKQSAAPVPQTQERVYYEGHRSTMFPIETDIGRSIPTHDDSRDDSSSQEEEDESESSDEEEEAIRRREILDSVSTEQEAWRQTGPQNFTSDDQPDVEPRVGVQQLEARDWGILVLDFDDAPALGWEDSNVLESGILSVGALFRSKDDLAIAVGLYHMENHVEYAVHRSSTTRLWFVCKHGNGCPFMLRAVQSASIWRVIKVVMDHTCHTDLNRTAPRQIPARVVGRYFARKLVGEGVVLKPKEMISEMQRLFGIEINYSFALRARNIAIEMTYGDFGNSYQMLPSYLYMLRMSNPGTLYDLEMKDDGKFHHMFVALGQSVAAFEKGYLRPVIVVDGTHLKGRNGGILFVAVTKDGNEAIFPLAVGLGPIENDESWTWFFHRLRTCFGQPDDLLIVSDQHKSIRNAVECVYPNVPHGLCYYHIQKNLAHYGQHVAAVFKAAAYSYRSDDFQRYFSALQLLKVNAHTRLDTIGVERWARSKCPVRRTSFMTSNAAETMNSRLLWARRLPVASLIETYRAIMEKWFDRRRISAASRSHELTEVVEGKLHVAVEAGRQLAVRGTTTHMFSIEDDHAFYIVDLENRTCSCAQFDLDDIPCRHACAAIRRAGLQVTDFVGGYFKQSVLLATYMERIVPVPHPTYWNVPDEISAYVVKPPDITVHAGRPKLSRARSAVEGPPNSGPPNSGTPNSRPQVCSRCKGGGHNARRCKAQVGPLDLNVPVEGVEQPPDARRRRKKKCGICRSGTHTRNACPQNVGS
ncbi:uncharacterized protein LOC131018454 [Salvia miltiorrhiza]|uniref:uncharacterized protein LOC131018454 n=1 Tax=Salvia miltiorrhiza TaxID=226208 RepID=UPI0025AC7B35|nr:uncharacterized protein LOC131018454 [Salvia miltiorrhiza]